MTRRDDDDLHGLRRLPRTAPPPAGLEDRVVHALRQAGLIAAGRSRASAIDHPAGRWLRPRWALAAALALALSSGWTARGLLPRDGLDEARPAPAAGARQFMLLLAEPRGLATTKSQRELVAEYREWALGLVRDGHLVSAARLRQGGVRLAADAGGELQRSDEAAWTQATGYFVVRASSREEAVALVADCPHLAYGGEVSVREVARDP